MTTCSDIITRAYHLGGIVALGVTPKAKEAEFGLEALQSLYDHWIEGGMFGRLTDVYKTANYTAEEGERVIAPTSITVTKPTTVDDRAPYELACIVTILAGTQTNYIYENGAWVSLTGLTITDAAPLSSRNRQGLSAVLAMQLAETFGKQLGPLVGAQARGLLRSLMWKLGSAQPVQATEYF